MVSLATVSTAVAKKARVCVKDSWEEPLNIYTLTVLPPANRKSAVFRDATRPLRRYMREEKKRLDPEIREAQSRRRIVAKRLKHAEKAAAEAPAGERDRLEREACRLAGDLAAIVVPEPLRLIADDATAERLVSLMAKHDGRMAVLSAEGGVFGMMAGRYSRDGSPNFEVFLQAWGGDEIYVDRVGRPAEYIPDPALTMGLTVQPSVLQGLMEKAGFRDRGLPARFLYSIPMSPVGRRDSDPPPMPPFVHSEYQRRVTTLLYLAPDSDEHGNPRSHSLVLTHEARMALRCFQAELEPRLGAAGDLDPVSDWAGKLTGSIARVAGLLHVAEHAGVKPPWEVSVDVQTVIAAMKIGRYLLPHAQAAFAQMGADQDIEQAKRILAWILNKQIRSFSRREAYEALKGRLRRVEDLATPMGLLLDHNYIRRAPIEERSGPGRPPSPEFEVNPLWASRYSQNPQNSPRDPHSANSANSASAPPGENEIPDDDLEEGIV